MSEYGGHDPEDLGDYYTKHVMAMTTEKLHHKGDIAVELAYRDKRIAELEAENQQRRESNVRLALDIASYESENQRLKHELEVLRLYGNKTVICEEAVLAENQQLRLDALEERASYEAERQRLWDAACKHQREVDAGIAESMADEWQEPESDKWPEMQDAETGCRSVAWAIREQKIND